MKAAAVIFQSVFVNMNYFAKATEERAVMIFVAAANVLFVWTFADASCLHGTDFCQHFIAELIRERSHGSFSDRLSRLSRMKHLDPPETKASHVPSLTLGKSLEILIGLSCTERKLEIYVQFMSRWPLSVNGSDTFSLLFTITVKRFYHFFPHTVLWLYFTFFVILYYDFM